MNKDLFITSADLAPLQPITNNIGRLIKAVETLPGVPVADVTLGDLMLPSSKCHGIYFFVQGEHYSIKENEGEVACPGQDVYWYIGKTAGRAIPERLGAHLASSPGDYMNILMRNVAWLLSDKKTQKEFKDWIKSQKDRQIIEKLYEQTFPIISDLRLKIVLFDNHSNNNVKDCIVDTERLLIQQLRPFLNDPNRRPRQIVLRGNNITPLQTNIKNIP